MSRWTRLGNWFFRIAMWCWDRAPAEPDFVVDAHGVVRHHYENGEF